MSILRIALLSMGLSSITASMAHAADSVSVTFPANGGNTQPGTTSFGGLITSTTATRVIVTITAVSSNPAGQPLPSVISPSATITPPTVGTSWSTSATISNPGPGVYINYSVVAKAYDASNNLVATSGTTTCSCVGQ